MLLDDDVVTDGKAEASPLSGRLGRKERIEYFLLQFGRNAGAVVADSNFHAISEVLGRRSQGGLVIISIGFRLALGRCVEAVRDKVQQSPCDVLRKDIGCTSSGIQ